FFHEIPETLLQRINARPRFRGAGGTGDYYDAGASGITSIAAPMSQNVAPGIPWRIGQSVMHAKFGAGVIVSAEGRGADARVQVNFREQGLKWLALEYAKLTAA
ncbi:MAG: DNA helicase II, partial [Burkholderiales bacterium]